MTDNKGHTNYDEDDSLLEQSNDEYQTQNSLGDHIPKSSFRRNIESFKATHTEKDTYSEQQSREVNLRQELENVRKVNAAIEGVIHSLEKAKANMKTVYQTVGAASSLLNTWTRILSQTEHNQRLILDPTWHGTSQDMADIEADAAAEQQASLRRETEERERKEVAARKEEEEKRKAAEAAKTTRQSTRGRGRGIARGSGSQRGSIGAGVQANAGTTTTTRGSASMRRTPSGIGRARAGRDQT